MPSSGVQTCALDRKSTRLNSSHTIISYAVFCLKKKNHGRGRRGADGHHGGDRDRDAAGGATHAGGERRPAAAGRRAGGRGLRRAVFFFNDTAPTEIYPLSLPDALPINDTATTEIYTLSLHDVFRSRWSPYHLNHQRPQQQSAPRHPHHGGLRKRPG